MRHRARAVLWGVVLCLASAGAAMARQCEEGWVEGDGLPGTSDLVYCSTRWDPDGPGPRAEVIVLGGLFTYAGTGPANRIAMFDPATGEWGTFGSGFSNEVRALAVMPDGSLVAGGFFGSGSIRRVARWDGAQWQPIGAGFEGNVYALHVHNGDLYAGGQFITSGPTSVRSVARFDGSAWQPLGSGSNNGTNGVVRTIATSPAGELVVAGAFSVAGTTSVINVARFNGTSWSAMGSGVFLDTVYTLAVLPGGGIAVAGRPGSSAGVMRWNGTAWAQMGLAFDNTVFSLGLLPSGDLVAGGAFTRAGTQTINYAARWTGTAWTPLAGGAEDFVYRFDQTPSGELMMSRRLNINGVVTGATLDRVDASSITPMAPGFNKGLSVLEVTADGRVIAGGSFTSAGNVHARHLAWQDAEGWHELGGGLGRGLDSTSVTALKVLSSGEVLVSGNFDRAGGVTVANIARWDGATWHPLGSGLGGIAIALLELPNGDVIAGGGFPTAGGVSASRIARWDGKAWNPLGAGIGAGQVYQVQSLARLPNGDIVAGGNFATAGGVDTPGIARWDGTAWHALGTGLQRTSGNPGASAMLALPNGDLIVGGTYTGAGGVPVNNIARWDGAAWHPLGDGLNSSVRELALLPDGDILAVGGFTMSGTTPVSFVARWDGSAWHPVGTGTDGALSALALNASGDVLVGGFFRRAGGLSSANFARFRADAPLPVIDTEPSAATACLGGLAHFSVHAVGASAYQWRKDGNPLDTSEIPSAAAADLELGGVRTFYAGVYDCVVSGECGNVTSDGASLSVCVSDATCDGSVNSQDFFAFLVHFFALDARADVNDDGGVTSQDFFDFLGAFFAGC
jgi:hypothetical protein